MTSARNVIFFIVLFVIHISDAEADEFVQFDGEQALVCATGTLSQSPPDPVSANCQTMPELEIDPYKETVWLVGSITPSHTLLNSDKPIGLFVSAKASSRVFLNGKLLASNGSPGLSPASEEPGRIDAVFFVKRDQLRPGSNEIAILMSGHHSWLRSTRSILTLGLFTYLAPPHHERDYAWLSLLTFGAFILFGLYAAALAWFRVSRIEPITQ